MGVDKFGGFSGSGEGGGQGLWSNIARGIFGHQERVFVNLLYQDYVFN